MYIDGFGIAGYRSFGSKLQRIGPFDKINLFVGQNNTGKSNILSFLMKRYNDAVLSVKNGDSYKHDPGDKYIGTNAAPVTFALPISVEKAKSLFESRGIKLGIRMLNQLPPSMLTGDTFWLSYAVGEGRVRLDDSILNEYRNILSDAEWSHLWESLMYDPQRGASMTGGSIDDWIPKSLHVLVNTISDPPQIDLIPAIRKIGDAGTSPEDHSGIGIIDRLAQLQNPSHDKQELKQRFEQINVFLRTVTESKEARLEIPYDRDMILVRMDNKTLPLSSLGTGIHEVVILAAAATVLEKQVICIEEPELHLHPRLQKKLINYLGKETDNQYFITTHSAHLLETEGAAIFHVRNQDGQTTVDPVITATDRSLICADLGYRASDLMQANCIIWVEGPSDRIYINHWIKAVDAKLREGLDYSIMFYGGRLLSHLSADDPDIKEFISLRRLNRYMAIVMDSDKKSKSTQINKTKKRIQEEFSNAPGFSWITKGREIENYIRPEILAQALGKRLAGSGIYDKLLPENADKVKVARNVAKNERGTDIGGLNVHELNKMVAKLVTFIKEANE